MENQRKIHLVGSICGTDTAASAFRKAVKSFPNLYRLPDGEPGNRSTFIQWQRDVFKHDPSVLRKYDKSWNSVSEDPVPEDQIKSIVGRIPPLHPGYDDYALESYAEFRRLKNEGVIPTHVRFQVCLPTPFVVVCLVRDGFQAVIEPLYEKALLSCLENIQNKIPHHDLAIQWDIAGEMMPLEGHYLPHFKPWFPQPYLDGFVGRIARLVNTVASDVETGLHICYGDWGHQHFIDPKDTGLMVALSNGILDNARRPINWIHMPVPRHVDDEGYFSPLKELDLESGSDLFLGLVHANDAAGTQRKIDVAKSVLGQVQFGIGTECGLGRTPEADFQSISDITNLYSRL